jgi:hypothetical protein
MEKKMKKTSKKRLMKLTIQQMSQVKGGVVEYQDGEDRILRK